MEPPFRWTPRPCTGDPVPSLGGYSLTSVPTADGGGAALLFGGCDAFGVAHNEAYMLDVWTWRWTLLVNIDTQVGPCPRLSHSTTLVAPSTQHDPTEKQESALILVFGGMRAVPEEQVFNDLWAMRLHFVVDAKRNKRIHAVTWEAVEATGTRPSARHSHAAVAVDHGRSLLVVGGSGESQQPLGDVYALNVNSYVWSKLEVSMLPREMASAVVRTAPHSAGGPATSNTEEVIVAGGRTENGKLLADAVVLALHFPNSATSTTMFVQSMTMGNAMFGRCNHQLVLLGESKTLLLAVGGLDEHLQRQGGHSTSVPAESDELVLLAEELGEGEAQRHVARMERPLLSFGFGHALCSLDCVQQQQHKQQQQRVVAGSGIVPNKIGTSLDMFELVRSR